MGEKKEMEMMEVEMEVEECDNHLLLLLLPPARGCGEGAVGWGGPGRGLAEVKKERECFV